MKLQMIRRIIALLLCVLLLVAQGTAATAEATLRVGDYVRFGTDYVWQVVHVEGGVATLLLDGYMKGVFDSTMHMEAHSISLMRYHGYGSVSWEFSDLRQWLNAREEQPRYRDVTFDYSDQAQGMSFGALKAVIQDTTDAASPYEGKPGFLSAASFSEMEYWLIEPRVSQHLIPNTQSNVPVVAASEFSGFTADMDALYGERIQHTIGRSETIDRVFVLSGREVQSYLLDNGMPVSRLANGSSIPAYWLRDSVYVDMGNVGYYFYYGLYQLTASNGGASDAYAEHSAAIRPACCINLSYVTGLSGSGTAENPYGLRISSSVVNRPISGGTTPGEGSTAPDAGGSTGAGVVELDESYTASTFTQEQFRQVMADGRTLQSSVLRTGKAIQNCTSLTLHLRIDELRHGNVEGQWGFYIQGLDGGWVLASTFDLTGDEAVVHISFDEPVSFDAWTIPCQCLGDSWDFSFSTWLEDVRVIR